MIRSVIGMFGDCPDYSRCLLVLMKNHGGRGLFSLSSRAQIVENVELLGRPVGKRHRELIARDIDGWLL